MPSVSDFEAMIGKSEPEPEPKAKPKLKSKPSVSDFEAMLDSPGESTVESKAETTKPGIFSKLGDLANAFARSHGEAAIDRAFASLPKTPPPKPKPIIKVEPLSPNRMKGFLGTIPIPGVTYSDGDFMKVAEEEEPGNIVTAIGENIPAGIAKSTTGGMADIFSEAYKLVKGGDLPAASKLITTLGSGGIVGIDPSKGILEGGITSESGRNLTEAMQHYMEGKPATALVDLIESIPYIGMMLEHMDTLLEEGQYGEAIGAGIGTLLLFKLAPRYHKSIKDDAAMAALDEYSRTKIRPSGNESPQQLATIRAANEAKLLEINKRAPTNILARANTKINNLVTKLSKLEPPEKISLEQKHRIAAGEGIKAFRPADDAVSQLEQIAKEKGKKIEDLTPEDLDKWMSEQEFYDSIDLDTGTPTPPALVGDASPFRVSPDITKARDIAYGKNPMIASTIMELRNMDPSVPKDPMITSHKLLNDVNKWVDGAEVNIDQVRDFLSDLAANSDEFKWSFVTEAGEVDVKMFNEWKDMVSEGAKWARRTSREIEPSIPEPAIVPGVEKSSTLGRVSQPKKINWTPEQQAELDRLVKLPVKGKPWTGSSFYSGIPIDKLVEVGKAIAGYEKKLADAKRVSPKEAHGIVKESLTRQWLSAAGNIRRKLESYGDRAYPIIQQLALSSGGSPRAKNMRRQATKEYRSGMTNFEKRLTDRLIMAKRVLAIDKTSSGKRVKYPEAYSVENSKIVAENFGSKAVNGVRDLTPEEIRKIDQASETYFSWMRRAVQDAFEGGLIGAEERKALLASDYFRFDPVASPTIAGIFDKKREVREPGKSPRNVYDSGIETLAKGKLTDIFEINSELVMLDVFSRFYNRLQNNLGNAELQKLAREQPTNPFSRVREPKVVDMKKQPTSRRGLIQSIHIKKDELKISDYEYKAKLREAYKTSSTKKLTIAQLKEFEASLGGPSKEYRPQAPAERIPKGWKRHFVYENGSRKSIYLEPKFSEEWNSSWKVIDSGAARWLRWMSGTNVVKMFATGAGNPFFALRNLPRDTMHAWFASRIFENGKWKSVYSNNMPKAMAQMADDFRAVFSDAWHKTGRYNDFIDDGGGMDLLTVQGNPFRKGLRLENTFDKIYDAMSFLNETSEILTRLAIRERVIKNETKARGISIDEARKIKEVRQNATFAAVDQMNFGDLGVYARGMNNIMPYFGARIVGTRSLWRTLKAKEGWVKLSQFAALTTGLYLLLRKLQPEAMEALKDDPRSQGNLVIPFGAPYEDENGEKRYPFFKIPIDQSQRFFKALFEGFADKWNGNEVDVEKLWKSLKDASPTDVTQLPPSMSALIGYLGNLDLWTFKKIWNRTDEPLKYTGPTWIKPGGDILKTAEGFTQSKGSATESIPGRTPKGYTDLGALTGLSPERTKYAIEELLTSDNLFMSLALSSYKELFDQLPPDQRETILKDMLAKVPGIKSVYGVTNPTAEMMRDVEAIKQARMGANYEINAKLDDWIDRYLRKGTADEADVIEFIQSQNDPLKEKNMLDELKFAEATKDLKHRVWWMALRRLDVQGRAEAYIKRMKRATPAEIEQINEEAEVISGPDAGGVFTPEFLIRVEEMGY